MPPVCSCQPSPGQELAAESAPGLGSRSLGGPAEPAGLPGEPVPGAEAAASAQTGGAQPTSKPEHPPCQGSTRPSWERPSYGPRPCTHGQGAARGSPTLEAVSAFWGDPVPFGVPEGTSAPIQLPSLLPKEGFLGAGRLLRAHRPGQVLMERDGQAMGSNLHQPSRSVRSGAPAAPPGNTRTRF